LPATAFSEAEAEAASEKTSAVLVRLAAEHPGPEIRMGEVVAALGDRGLGLAILMIALPNLLPGPAMPGYSTIFGVPIAVLSVRLLGRNHNPHLPGWIERRSLSMPRFRLLVAKAAPLLRRIEAVLHPRRSFFTSSVGIRTVGALLFATAIFLSAPVPLAGWLPTIAIIVMALGLIEKDGHALAVGAALAVVSWAAVVALIFVSAELIAFFAGWFF
jgi:hypothetical protein